MAHRPKLMALTRLINSRGGEAWILDEIASGRSVAALSRELECASSLLRAYLEHPRRVNRFREAQRRAASAWADEMLELADAATPDDWRARQLRINVRKWLAEKHDPQQFGQAGPNVQISAGSIHVAVLQAVEEAARPRPELILPPPRQLLSGPEIEATDISVAPPTDISAEAMYNITKEKQHEEDTP